VKLTSVTALVPAPGGAEGNGKVSGVGGGCVEKVGGFLQLGGSDWLEAMRVGCSAGPSNPPESMRCAITSKIHPAKVEPSGNL